MESTSQPARNQQNQQIQQIPAKTQQIPDSRQQKTTNPLIEEPWRALASQARNQEKQQIQQIPRKKQQSQPMINNSNKPSEEPLRALATKSDTNKSKNSTDIVLQIRNLLSLLSAVWDLIFLLLFIEWVAFIGFKSG